MNYLVIEGYKEAAERFAKEASLSPSTELSSIEDRMRIRSAIQAGRLEEALDRINDLAGDLLDSHPRLYFHLQQQRLVELIRTDQLDAALAFAQDILAPKAEAHPEFLRELERTMAMLVWHGHGGQTPGPGKKDSSALQGLEQVDTMRIRLANEVNHALLATQCQEHESKLPALLRTLHLQQEKLGNSGRVAFPKVVDYALGAFEPSLK